MHLGCTWYVCGRLLCRVIHAQSTNDSTMSQHAYNIPAGKLINTIPWDRMKDHCKILILLLSTIRIEPIATVHVTCRKSKGLYYHPGVNLTQIVNLYIYIYNIRNLIILISLLKSTIVGILERVARIVVGNDMSVLARVAIYCRSCFFLKECTGVIQCYIH